MSSSSIAFALSLSACVALAYGLAFVGLWLQYRRAHVLSFAWAWLGLGITSLIGPLVVLSTLGFLPGDVFLDVLYATATICTLLTAWFFLDAAYVWVGAVKQRRLLWMGFPVTLVLIGVCHLLPFTESWSFMEGIGPRLFASVTTIASLLVIGRSNIHIARRSLFAGQALVGLRFSGGLFIESLYPGVLTVHGQPLLFTIFQLTCIMFGGFLTTAAIYANQREAAVQERLALERELAKVRKMESLGRMANSVAHDFNNVLAIVLSACELGMLDDSTTSDKELAKHAISQAVASGNALTHKLLVFSNPNAEVATVFAPIPRLLEMLPLMRQLAGKQVEIQTKLEDTTHQRTVQVSGDPSQFDQLLLNLTANARDAMPGGGRIEVSAHVEQPVGIAKPSASGSAALKLTFSDTGTGIAPEAKERLFEPFFTTKEPGKGTGLGLATAFAFLRQAQGKIEVSETSSSGTTFMITLPLLPDYAANDGHVSLWQSEARSSGATGNS